MRIGQVGHRQLAALGIAGVAVLRELLGVKNVRNYDGSWTEYGSLVGVPVALGDEPGNA